MLFPDYLVLLVIFLKYFLLLSKLLNKCVWRVYLFSFIRMIYSTGFEDTSNWQEFWMHLSNPDHSN